MYAVVKSLIEKGHKAIAFIGGPKELNMSRDRLSGYMKAITDNGLDFQDALIYQGNDFTEETGNTAITEINKFQKPTAIVTTDDLLAFGVIKYLNENRLDAIAVVGFNNVPLSQYQKPALSSVDINAQMLGYYAAKLLIASLNEEDLDTNHFTVDTKLVERASSLFTLRLKEN
jgi:DNA-binding LacI/PurR family transcriptional regulator